MMQKRFRNAGSSDQPNISRRRFLAGAAIAPLLLWLPGRSYAASTIHQIEGEVFVNNRPATEATAIRAGDKIVVAHGGKLAMSIGGDAFLLREGTVLEIAGHGVISGLRLLTGAMLSVFAKRRKSVYITTSIATIGIRGTGVYMSTQPHRLYTCTCYGETDLRMGHHVEHISATYHNAHEISPDSGGTMEMKSMLVVDHTDDELRMLEGYVGRKPAFDM
jgi:hypothetical protein